MRSPLTKKDVIALNQYFEDGTLHNEGSLDFALDYARRTTNWTRGLAWLTRAILLDHVFKEGNKRTAALLIATYAEMEGDAADNERLIKLVKSVISRNTTSITRIEEMIKDALR